MGALVSDIHERDAATSARGGADYEEILAQLREEERVDAIVNDLRNAFPDTFAGIEWEPGPTLVVRYKGALPSTAAQFFFEVSAPVKTARVSYSESELESYSGHVSALLDAAGYNRFVVGIDPRDQQIVVTMGSESSKPVGEVAVKAALSTTAAPVRLSIVSGPVSIDLSNADIYGGAELYKDFQTFKCTTGFTVENTVTGVRGTSTAGHCSDISEPSNFYYDPFKNNDSGVTNQAWYNGTYGDFRWLSTGGAGFDDFYYDSTGTRRDVTAVKTSFSPGGWLYWYGRKTKIGYGSTIGYVGISNGTAGNLVCVYSNAAQVGDSGGPVYNGTLAAGSITSSVLIDGVWRLCFSQMQYIDNGLSNIQVRTS